MLSAIPPNQAASLLQGSSIPSTSPSPSVTYSSTSTVSSSADIPTALTARELKIACILDIDLDMTKQEPPTHLRDYYKKYSTLVSLIPKIKSAPWKHPDSGWEGKPLAECEVIEIFIGKSSWHNSWQPKFSRVIQHFPEMKKWLEKDSTQQLTKKLWGKDEDQPFKLKDLQNWMDNNGTLCDTGSKGLKGKAKAQENVKNTAGASGSGGEKKKKKTVQSAR